MLSIHKQKIEKQDFSIFLRDLASNVNTNLKHMIEDNIKDDSPSINEKKNYHKNKKKVIKKKDIIIQEQNKKRAKKQIEDDIKKIDFLFKTMDHTNPFGPIREFKTEEGKTAWKVKLFEYFWSHKKKYMNFVILLYFELKETNIPLLAKVEKVLNDYDSKLFMMNELGHMLPPLNNWDKSIKSFKECLKAMIVSAPWGETNDTFLISINDELGKALEALVPQAFGRDEDSDGTEENALKKE